MWHFSEISSQLLIPELRRWQLRYLNTWENEFKILWNRHGLIIDLWFRRWNFVSNVSSLCFIDPFVFGGKRLLSAERILIYQSNTRNISINKYNSLKQSSRLLIRNGEGKNKTIWNKTTNLYAVAADQGHVVILHNKQTLIITTVGFYQLCFILL